MPDDKKDLPSATPLANRRIQPRFGELAQGCRELAMNRLAEHLGGMFGQVDDALFECAEKAENNQLQGLFFDSMREIRRQRPGLERSFHQRIASGFGDFIEGRLQSPTSPAEIASDSLSLVQNEEYEESLQVANMASRVKSRCAQPLFGLERRLAVLNGGHRIAEDANPFGPLAIAQAFREALEPTEFQVRIKTILYMLFDRHVMRGLDDLYEALNTLLINAGVLPNLKYGLQRQPDGSRRTAPTSAPALAPDLDAPPPADLDSLFAGVSSLLGEYRRREGKHARFGASHGIDSLTPQDAARRYSDDELRDALDRLQADSARELLQRLQQPQTVDEFKRSLKEQLESHSSHPGEQKLPENAADTVDLVGMLFDFILNDRNLPDNCRATLSHLHMPLLKVALHDHSLFTQQAHPLRRLLNAMAQASALYGSEGDNRGLLAKMQWVVERVVQDYQGELALFDNLREEFDAFVASLRQKVELRERREIEAAKGRDKLLEARQRAVEVARQALHGRRVPGIIRNFLELTWVDVLAFIQLRCGHDSQAWHQACESAELLAWSCTPLASDEERQRLQQLRRGLLENLHSGLELLGGYHEDGIRRLLQDMVACQHAVQAKRPDVAARLEAQLPESKLGAMLGEPDEASADAPPLSSRARQLAEELQQLEFGTWFEFVEGERTRRAKLSWFSPTTHNYMFVDRAGQRIALKQLAQLAEEMEQGLARIVPSERSTPLVDRALTSIYRVLQRFTGRAAQVT